MTEKKEHFESYGILLYPSEPWEYDLYGFHPNRVGDSISWMMFMACSNPGYVKYIPICAELLKAKKRWPNELQKDGGDRIAKTKIQYGWSKLWWQNFEFKKRPVRAVWSHITRFFGLHQETRLYRTQHGQTRDPWTHFFAACKINNEWDQAEDVHPPRSIYSPTFWAWQKYLHTGEKKWRRRYLRREGRGTPARQYVKDMALVRAKSAGCWHIYRHIKDLEVKPNKG